MTKSTTENSPAATDDARSADTPKSKENRDALAAEAEKGLRKAVKETADPKGKA